MNILFVSAEVAPYSKAGGLADVAGSLPQALAHYVSTIQVITPLYGVINREEHGLIPAGFKGEVELGDSTLPYSLYSTSSTDGSVQTWFVENEHYFGREGIYTENDGKGYQDNNSRYFFFQLVVIDILQRKLINAELIHCNDHHTGLIPALIKSTEIKVKTIFTIHNFLYHGHFSNDELSLLPNLKKDLLTTTQWNNFSALLEGIDHADYVTTVSPGYASELLQGYNVDPYSHKRLISAKTKFSGIVNGIDLDYWNPATDTYLAHHYSITDTSGKIKNKLALQAQLGFKQDDSIPLIGSISRLVENKGFPLILDILDEFAAQGIQFIFLGSGDPNIAKALREASFKYPDQIAFDEGYNEPLAHLIEAGVDIFLMPSRFEPCGLNQLYSLRYGTIPVVSDTGGLSDTVINWTVNKGTGFVFKPYERQELKNTLQLALAVYKDSLEWDNLVHRAMSEDYSWDQSALQYYRIYTK